MQIILSPIASNYTTTVSVDGLTLTIDGVPIDLSVIPEGGQAEGEQGSPFLGIVTRDKVVVKYHYDAALAVPDQPQNWEHYTYEITSGDVPSPIIWKEEA